MPNVHDFAVRSSVEEIIDTLENADCWQLRRTDDDREPYLRAQIGDEWLELLGPDPQDSPARYLAYLQRVTITSGKPEVLAKWLPK